MNKKIPAFNPKPGEWKVYQEDVDRVQEFRKCIECFLCQNVCHVLREHDKFEKFAGPRFFVRVAGLEMHPMDQTSRAGLLKDDLGIGLLQHHQVLHRSLPRRHPHHRQRHHPAERTRRGRVLRPDQDAVPEVHRDVVASHRPVVVIPAQPSFGKHTVTHPHAVILSPGFGRRISPDLRLSEEFANAEKTSARLGMAT